MAMGRRQHRERQEDLWLAHGQWASAPGHPFYERLHGLLEAEGFDVFVEEQHCDGFAAAVETHANTPVYQFTQTRDGN